MLGFGASCLRCRAWGLAFRPRRSLVMHTCGKGMLGLEVGGIDGFVMRFGDEAIGIFVCLS